jgi:hypothetical protein
LPIENGRWPLRLSRLLPDNASGGRESVTKQCPLLTAGSTGWRNAAMGQLLHF